jgi:hypothetical protein
VRDEKDCVLDSQERSHCSVEGNKIYLMNLKLNNIKYIKILCYNSKLGKDSLTLLKKFSKHLSFRKRRAAFRGAFTQGVLCYSVTNHGLKIRLLFFIRHKIPDVDRVY